LRDLLYLSLDQNRKNERRWLTAIEFATGDTSNSGSFFDFYPKLLSFPLTYAI